MRKKFLIFLIVPWLLLGEDSSFIEQTLTKEEEKQLPTLIACSIWEMFQKEPYFDSFIEGMESVEKEIIDGKESVEVAAYTQYVRQVAVDPKIQKNIGESLAYLRKKQAEENAISVIEDRIYYKVLKQGKLQGISNKDRKIAIHFLIQDIEGNPIGGNYALRGPTVCKLSELISGMAHGMIGMQLHEIRQIVLHPEFVYGVFSDFGEGKAISITVELVGWGEEQEYFSPSQVPVDIVKLLQNETMPLDMISLQKAYLFSCGQRVWSFYKNKLPHIGLNEVVRKLKRNTLPLTSGEKKLLHKVEWMICTSS